MPNTTFATPLDFVRQSVASAYTPGAGQVTLDNAAPFGAPSPSAPVYVTFARQSAPSIPLATYTATGITGNALTGLTKVWGTDTALAVGDYVYVVWPAEGVASQNGAINALETTVAGHTATIATNTTAIASCALDASVVHVTGSETIAGPKTFTSTIVGSISGNAATATNGVVTTGSYADPAWITSLSASKLSGAVPVGNGGLGTTAITGLVKGTGTTYAAATAGTDYLTPTGNGSGLTALSAANISTGTLVVARGGTGAATLTGLVKGNGTSAFTAAAAGTDYLAPSGNGSALTGLTGSQITGNISGNAANVTGTVAIANGGTGQTTASLAINALVPTQTGQSGNVLGTNGTTVSWVSAGGSSTLALVRTAVKTANYTAVAGDLVPVDTTSGAVTVTLPTAPADKSLVCIKHIIQGGTNAVTVACGGSDVINKASGSTSFTLPLVGQSTLLQYQASTAIYTVIAADLSLTQLDLRFTTVGTSVINGSPTASGALYVDGSGLLASSGQLFFRSGTTGGALELLTTSSAYVEALLVQPGNVGTKCLVLKRISSQTANMLELQQSTGTPLFTFDQFGRPIASNSTPTVAAGTGAGTSPTVTINGTDVSGTVTIQTGTSPASGNSTLATITFANAYGSAPRTVMLSPGNFAAGQLAASQRAFVDCGNNTATTWQITGGSAALGASTTYKYNYFVIG